MSTVAEVGESGQRQIQAGDRFWVWLADEPSAFETHLADTLTVFPSRSELSEENNGVFHIKTYSWRGSSEFTQDFLKSYLPQSIEFPAECMVKFLRVEDELEFSIPAYNVFFT